VRAERAVGPADRLHVCAGGIFVSEDGIGEIDGPKYAKVLICLLNSTLAG
jgi:hypothetical protein